MELEIGQKVDILIGKETVLGFIVFIGESQEGSQEEPQEEPQEGLVYKSEIFSDLEEGIKTVGYIKNIREDEKIDISLRPLGYRNTIEDDKSKILYQLEQKKGTIMLTDKSSPESIKFRLQMSKKAFKRALGALYKEKKVLLHQDKITRV